MPDNDTQIYGGAFNLARQIFSSEIWLTKPATWKILWIYILGKVNHKPTKLFERGEGFFNFTQEVKQIGIDITSDKIKKFLGYARGSGMISTIKSTRGIRIKVLNYNKYQDFNNFKSTTESTLKARQKHDRSTTINKNDKNDKKGITNDVVAKPPKGISFTGLQSFLDSPQKHIRLIGRYAEIKGLQSQFSTPEQWTVFGKRWLKDAASITKFDEVKTKLAFEKAMEFPQWTLHTVYLKLTGQNL